MNLERINFLRDVVVEHIKSMPKIEDNGFKDVYGLNKAELKNAAVLNFDTYTLRVVEDLGHIDRFRLEEYIEVVEHFEGDPKGLEKEFEKISKQYDCGYSGCFAGWYLLLARAHKFLTEEEIREDGIHYYAIERLAQHFDITGIQAGKLFRTLGSGAECRIGHTVDTEEALDARVAYLDEMIAENALLNQAGEDNGNLHQPA